MKHTFTKSYEMHYKKRGNPLFLKEQEGFAPLLENFIEEKPKYRVYNTASETNKITKKIKRITQKLLSINQFLDERLPLL